MKLAAILANYLHERKKLNLAGIGSFTFDSSLRNDNDSIRFQSNRSVSVDEDVVQYISENTGKMKSLAAADLESYLELAKQFLNIGKPFHIEGIGTLVKTKSGDFEFTGDHVMSEKVKDTGMKELSATSISDHSMTTYESLKPQTDAAPPYRRIFLATLILLTAAIIIYLGYRISRSNSTAENKEIESGEQQPTNPPVSSSAAVATIADSSKDIQTTDPSGKQDFRFVIETATRNRALYRYRMLRDDAGLNLQMSTSDSIHYKLFVVIKASPADTARIADSLTIFYPALNKKPTYAEKQ